MNFPSPAPAPSPSPSPAPDDYLAAYVDIHLNRLLIIVSLLFLLFAVTMFFDIKRNCQERRHRPLLNRRWRRSSSTGITPSSPPPTSVYVASIICTYTLEQCLRNGDDCAICLEDFKYGDECRILMACDHGFHRSCIDEWLSRNNHCPLCRDSIRGGCNINLDQV